MKVKILVVRRLSLTEVDNLLMSFGARTKTRDLFVSHVRLAARYPELPTPSLTASVPGHLIKVKPRRNGQWAARVYTWK